MSSRTVINVGAGIVGGVIGFFVGGPQGAFLGFSLGYSLAGIAQGPEAPKSGSMRPDEFQMIQSSESATIPIIFGTSRLAGNYIEYRKGNFQSEAVYAEQEGGKGGGGSSSQQTGYIYKMTFKVGLCMGPVDYLVGIQGSPGMDRIRYHETTPAEENDVRDFAGGLDTQKFIAWIKNFDDAEEADDPEDIDEPIELTGVVGLSLKGRNDDGGGIKFFPGSRTQSEYRDVCFAKFEDFALGGSPAPRTYLFELTRFPRVRDIDGDLIAGFPVNASDNPADAEFGDANPAAVVWEILTDKIWGKGTPADHLNQADFIAAANFYQANRIGVSTSVGDDASNVQLVERFRELFGLVTWWDGSEIRCRALWDHATAYSNRIRITPEDTVGEPVFQRQSMAASTNELRLTFTNRENNWQTEAVTVQDLASIESIGGVRSVKVDAAEIGTRSAAEKIAHRILRLMAYPPATCQLRVLRKFGDLQPGEFIELITDGWRGDAMTTFWRVASVEDDLAGEDRYIVSLVEDTHATGFDGESEEFEAADPSWELDVPITNSDVVTEDNSAASPVGLITPTLITEPNIWISKNERRLLTAIQRRSGLVQSFSVGFREQAVGNYLNAGTFQAFAYTGTLVDALGATGPKIIRQAGDQFRLALNHPGDATSLLASASAVQIDADGLDILTATNTAILVIGREIFRVGFIEETATDEFTVRVAMRSEFATDKAAHAIGATFHFFPVFDRDVMTRATPRLPLGLPADVGILPSAVSGSVSPVFEVKTFAGESLQPLRPELVSATRVGTVWTIILRPRIHDGGSGFGPSFGVEMDAREADVGGLRLRMTRGATSVTLGDYFASGAVGPVAIQATTWTFTPTDGTSPATGVWTLVISFDTNPTSIDLRSVLSGRTSDALTVPQPA